MAAGMRPTLINNMHYYTIDLSLATKLRDWRVSEDGLINDNSASKRIRITKNNDKEIKIAFSSKFMMEALKTINSKDIRILLNSDIKPIILKTDEDENLIQLLLPIKTY